MPTTTAAAKAYRQNIKARARNTAAKDAIKKLAVQFRKAVTAKQLDKAKEAAAKMMKAYDKAVQKKILARNTAARKKSRLAAALRRATAA